MTSARWLIRTAWLGALGALTACSNGDDDAPPQSPQPQVWIEWAPEQFVGESSITGVIQFPEGFRFAGEGALVLTEADEQRDFANLVYVDDLIRFAKLLQQDQLAFRVSRLAPGNYLLGFIVNANQSDDSVDQDDIGGFVGGTSEAPAVFGREAAVLEVTEEPLTDVQFGVGELHCTGQPGDPCDTDADCGGTLCEYETAYPVGLRTGACDTSAHVCVLQTECPVVDGETGEAKNPGCFGAPRR